MIKTHMNNMKKYLSLCIMLLCLCSTVMAQQEKVVVKGVVTDEAKEPLIGVNVTVKDMPGLGSITDMNGHYSITMEPYRQLVFTYIGYESKEVMVKEQRTINVVMKESVTRAVDEVVITGTGVQRKLTQTGAITTVDVIHLPALSMHWQVMYRVLWRVRLPDSQVKIYLSSGFAVYLRLVPTHLLMY